MRATRPTCLVAAMVLAAAPVVVSVAWTWDGWASEGDSAVIALRSRDVLAGGGETPVVGMPTTLGSGAGAHHPGPLQFWVLAPVERLTSARHAPLASMALVNVACIVLSTFVLYRLGGPPARWRGARSSARCCGDCGARC